MIYKAPTSIKNQGALSALLPLSVQTIVSLVNKVSCTSYTMSRTGHMRMSDERETYSCGLPRINMSH